MTSLHRVVVEWSGTAVNGRACNVLYFSASDNTAPPVAAIQSAYNQIGEILPSGTRISVPAAGDTITDTSGALVGAWSVASAPAPTVGAAGGPVAAGVGSCVSWATGGIVPGTKGPRRLRGRTFLVPMVCSMYDTDGTLSTVAITKITAFGTALMGAGPLAVWHRPPKGTTVGGNSYGVQSFRLRDKVAVLRSRRD